VSQCKWCKGDFEEDDRSVHENFESCAGCWKIYGNILAKEYGKYNNPELTHRLTVNTYAVQHPGESSAQSKQSMASHLVSLYGLLEENSPVKAVTNKMQYITDNIKDLSWLSPPSFDGTLNVNDVICATNKYDHEERVYLWASSVWSCWKISHLKVIQTWYNAAEPPAEAADWTSNSVS